MFSIINIYSNKQLTVIFKLDNLFDFISTRATKKTQETSQKENK